MRGRLTCDNQTLRSGNRRLVPPCGKNHDDVSYRMRIRTLQIDLGGGTLCGDSRTKLEERNTTGSVWLSLTWQQKCLLN